MGRKIFFPFDSGSGLIKYQINVPVLPVKKIEKVKIMIFFGSTYSLYSIYFLNLFY